MAKKTQTILVDDIDGDLATCTISFALDNVEYQIDLNEANAAKLREAAQPWISSARRIGGRRRRGTGAATNAVSRGYNRKVRAWAQENGIKVSDRGRVSADIVARYEKENNQ